MIRDREVKLGARLGVLSKDEVDKVRSAALQVLEETGVDVLEEEARGLLEQAGAKVTDGQCFHIPADLVEQAIRTAPESVRLYGRDGRERAVLGGHNVCFGTGSDCPKIVDPFTGERRLFTREDVGQVALLADALDELDFHMSLGLVSDVPRLTSDRHQFEAMLLNTEKPIVFTAHDKAGMQDILSMARIAVGGRDALRARPSVCLYAEPVTPLRHIDVAVEKLLLAASEGIPVVYTPGATSGGTFPATLAGALVVATAEVLSGLTIHQLRKPGAPFIGGGVLTVMDMSTTIFSYGAAELSLLSAASTQVMHACGLPVFGTCGCSDSKELDEQAATEATFSTLMSALCGANLVHDIGYLEYGLLGSMEMVVLTHEVIGMAKRIMRGIEVNDDTLALDVIDKVGPGGQFLAEDHTLKHFRQEQFFPRLVDRQNWARWVASGRKPMRQRLNEEVRRILSEHEPQQLPQDRREEISSIVSEADKQLAGA